jgi:hypothetical protein
VPDLPPEAFAAYEQGSHELDAVHIISVERESGPRRIAMVAGGMRLQTDAGQPMLLAVPVAMERILSEARPQDSFALLAVGGPPVDLRFGASRDKIRAAVEQVRACRQWKRGGKGVLDALLEAASWFGAPKAGDSIMFFGGPPDDGASRTSQLRAALTNRHIRLLVFSGAASATTGGDLVSGSWERPLGRVCEQTGGWWQYVGYAGRKAADENLQLWQTEGESMYEMATSVYTLQLERTGPRVVIALSPQFRKQVPGGVVIYPRPLPVCPPPAGTASQPPEKGK